MPPVSTGLKPGVNETILMQSRVSLMGPDSSRHEQIRRRRWLISAQGWSAATTLGTISNTRSNPERVWRLANPYRIQFRIMLNGGRIKNSEESNPKQTLSGLIALL